MSFEHSFKMECIEDAPCYNCLRESRLSQLQESLNSHIAMKNDAIAEVNRLQAELETSRELSDMRYQSEQKYIAENARYRGALEWAEQADGIPKGVRLVFQSALHPVGTEGGSPATQARKEQLDKLWAGDLSGHQHNHEGCDCRDSSTCNCHCHNR